MHDTDSRRCSGLFSRRWTAPCFVLIAVIASGCAFQPFAQLKSNLRAMEKNSCLAGTVFPVARKDSRVFVSVYDGAAESAGVIAATSIDKGGYFAFIVPRGRPFCLAAFEDCNNSAAYEPGEPAAFMCSEKEATIDEDSRVVRSDLVLDPAQSLPGWLAAGIGGTEGNGKNCVHVAFGEVTRLNQPLFSAENGKKGLWAPFDFLVDAGLGIYFLEPYDPGKIPVLFINGAGGSPRDWAYFVDNLDRSRFQPWIFFYPSGERLESLARVLHGIAEDLRTRYRFPVLYLTAHSMGGLIARDFIQRQAAAGDPFVSLLVTLSTPWSGLESAKLGVTFAPAAVPCWYDIQAGSPYLDALFKRRLPPGVASFLLFGYRGDRNPLSENNDGIVTVKSQLRWEAQEEAVKVYGFNQEHESILVNRDVFNVYARTLDEAGRDEADRN